VPNRTCPHSQHRRVADVPGIAALQMSLSNRSSSLRPQHAGSSNFLIVAFTDMQQKRINVTNFPNRWKTVAIRGDKMHTSTKKSRCNVNEKQYPTHFKVQSEGKDFEVKEVPNEKKYEDFNWNFDIQQLCWHHRRNFPLVQGRPQCGENGTIPK